VIVLALGASAALRVASADFRVGAACGVSMGGVAPAGDLRG